MKRMVEMVGIGDTGPLCATLQVSPLHTDDIGMIILGSQGGTQANDYWQARDSTGAVVACCTSAGYIYCDTVVASTAVTLDSTQGVQVLNASVCCATTVSGELALLATKVGTAILSSTSVYTTTITGTSIGATRLTASNVWATMMTATNFGGTTLTATNISGVSELSATTAQIVTLYAETIYNTAGELTTDNVNATTITATSIGATRLTGTNVWATTVTASTYGGAANVYATTVTANTYGGAANVWATTITGSTVGGAPNIWATALTATCISGTAEVSATKAQIGTLWAETIYSTAGTLTINGNVNATQLTATRVGATTITATNVSGVSELSATTAQIVTTYAETLYSTAGDIDVVTVNATTVGTTNLCATTISATTITAANIYVSTSISAAAFSAATSTNGAQILTVINCADAATEQICRRKVGIVGTTGADALTALSISVPNSAVVAVDAFVAGYCTAGGAVTSAAAYKLHAMGFATNGTITYVAVVKDELSAGDIDAVFDATIVAGDANAIGLTVTGSASNDIVWAYDVSYITSTT